MGEPIDAIEDLAAPHTEVHPRPGSDLLPSSAA